MTQTARRATPHDIYVGERIREARLAEDMTQTDLAEYIGVSYQQLQKYETGTNRVPAARLELLVTVLRRPLNYFFRDVTDVRAVPDVSRMLADKDTHQHLSDYTHLNPAHRRAVRNLAIELLREQKQ